MTETRIVTAPVLIPDSPDCEYNLGENTLTTDEIKQFKDSFDKYQIFDLNHDYENKIRQGIMPENRGELLDSYILTKPTEYTNINNETQILPEGSWLVKSRITDPEAIKLYDQGKIRAYSATVVQELKGTIMNLIKNSSTKSLNIAPTYKQDLRKNIIDPVLYTISYVDQPCQPETVFCKLCDINNNNYNNDNLDNTSTKSTKKDKVEVYQMTEDKENKINNIFQNAREEVNNLFTKANVKEDKDKIEDKTESKKEDKDKDKDKLEYITKNELTKILDDKMKTVSETISTKLTENLTNQLTEQKASAKAKYLTKEEVNTIIEDNFSKFEDSVIERVTLNNKASIKSYKDKLSKDIKGTNEKVPDVKKDEPVLGRFEGRDAFGNRIN